MPSFDAITIPMRPGLDGSGFTTDLWDAKLHAARGVDQHTTGALARRVSHVVVPAALTALVGAIGLGRPGLWTDELATWGMATTPWHDFWPVLRYVDAVLAPYYAFMHVWVSIFGDSDVSLRAPSLLSMVGAAALVGAIGAKVASRRVGLVAGIVFAVLPSTSRFAAEARPFALTVLCACLATWLLLRCWAESTVTRWLAYALGIVVLGWLHVVAILLVAAHAWVVLTWRRSLWWPFAAAAAVGGIASVPILYYGAAQRHQVAYISPVGFVTAVPYSQVLFGGLAVAVFIAALALGSLPLRLPSAIFAAWALVPPMALILVSLVLPMFLPRYLVFTTPGWALLAGAALARLRVPWASALLVVLAVLTVPAQVQMRGVGGHDQATRQLVDIIAARQQPGDAVAYASDEPIGAWTARDAVDHYLAPGRRPRDVLATNPPRHAGLLLATECDQVQPCLAGVQRLWVVRATAVADPLAGMGPGKENVLRRD
ncbi:MAG: glycosyltransferase family 39 protein, partial [Betaproteobacteria bacterium]